MQGVVEQISSKMVNTRFGQKPAYSIKVNGNWMSAGFKAPPCTEGQLIQFDVSTSGKYQNAENITPLAGEPATGIQGTSVAPSSFSKDRCIVRQNNLGHAVQILTLRYSQGFPVPSASDLTEQAMILSRMLELYCMQEGGVTEALDEKLNSLLDAGNELPEELHK